MSGRPLGLFTDLYELTMAAAFHAEGIADVATFDLFVRALPTDRDFLVVCGIETALDDIARFTYGPDEIEYLRQLELFDDDFLARLGAFRFDGEVRAMTDGELAYANEPLLSITAPIVEAQLLETVLINTVGLETMVASKAARVALACGDHPFVDFSARRDHGRDAAFAVARASYVAGAAATSLVEAGRRYGLDLSGTMAHSYVMAYGDEIDAFRSFLHHYGAASVLLVDTYDTIDGTRAAVAAMDAEGVTARGIRLDSGDLGALARRARRILDDAGYESVVILASGDLDEDRIAALRAAEAPIDAYGVGTRLGTSADAPYLSLVYKLVELGGKARVKRSEGKATFPGRKQVWRGDDGDVIALEAEPGPPGHRGLLDTVVRDGRRVGPPGSLAAARARCSSSLRAWTGAPPTVRISRGLQDLAVVAGPRAADGSR